MAGGILRLRGLALALDGFPRERSATADALTYCDMTTSSIGMHVSLKERAAEIRSRYNETGIVVEALRQAMPPAMFRCMSGRRVFIRGCSPQRIVTSTVPRSRCCCSIGR